MEIEIASNHFQMLVQKALFWKEKKTLIISDLHLGKISHFRKEGIALPSIALQNNFQRLDTMMKELNVERIIFLGDFFHDKYNNELKRFAAWREQHRSVEMTIVLGNHDILPVHLYKEMDVKICDDLKDGPFMFLHHPQQTPKKEWYTFCGHIHPVYCFRSSAKQSLRFPCFVFDEHQAVLPSFGIFTGGYEMESQKLRKIFAVVETKIMAV